MISKPTRPVRLSSLLGTAVRTKRVVLKERVVIRKRVATETVPVRTELRREPIEIDVDESLKDRVEVVDDGSDEAA